MGNRGQTTIISGGYALQMMLHSTAVFNVKKHRKSPLTPLFQSGELQPALKNGVERSGGGELARGRDFVSYC